MARGTRTRPVSPVPITKTHLPRVGLFLLPAVAAALFSTWLLLQRQSLWFDEAFTAAVGPLPVGDIVRAVVTGEGPVPGLADTPPSYNGPYYVVVHGWLALTGMGPSEVGLRMLSVVAFVAAVGLLTAALVRLLGTLWGRLAAGAVAVNPFMLEYSTEARPYMLALCASAGAFLLWLVWMDTGSEGQLRWLAGGFTICGAAATALHWYSALVLVALLTLTWWHHRDKARAVTVGAAVACSPAVVLASIALVNGVGTSGAGWIQSLGPLSLFDFVREIAGFRVPLFVVLVGGLALAAWRIGGDLRRIVMAVVVVVPVVITVVVSLTVRPVFVSRYLLVVVALVPALAMAGMARLPGRVRWCGAVLLLAVSVHASVGVVGDLPRENFADAVALVKAHRAVGEPLVAPARWEALVVSRYEPDVVTPEHPLSERVRGATTVWLVRHRRGGLPGDAEKRVAAAAALTAAGFTPVDDVQFKGREFRVVVERWSRTN